MVGLDYSKSSGCIHSKDMFLETIPRTGWGTFNLWIKDPQIRVEGKEFNIDKKNSFKLCSGELTELVNLLQS